MARALLRDHLAERVPDYMVPATLSVVGSLPRTPSGKVDRRALPAPARQRQVDEGYVAPRGELEEALSWQFLSVV